MTNRDFYERFYVPGKYNPSDPGQVRVQLSGDGHLMLEGWIFEHLLSQYFHNRRVQLDQRFAQFVYISDLLIGFSQGRAVIFKMVANREEANDWWAPCCHLATAIGGPPAAVYLVTVESGKLLRKNCTSRQTRFEPWIANPKYFTPKDPDSGRQDRAIMELTRRMNEGELRRLSMKRLVINCLMMREFYPCMDIDGVLLNGPSNVAFVEFKRRDPSCDNRYGLDANGSFRIFEACEEGKIGYLHIVLRDPITRARGRSPIDILSSDQDPRVFLWEACTLTRHSREVLDFKKGFSKSADSFREAGTPYELGQEPKSSQMMFPASLMTRAAVGLYAEVLDLREETRNLVT